MEFRIADTFTDSLARLAAEDQKAAKMAAFDLQLNPAHPSLQFHKLDKAKDPIAGHLPAEAAEALLNLATGIRPPVPERVAPGGDPFEHPDALRRFRIMKNIEELALALDYPWERWAVFLHPEQRKLVEKKFNGPARVSVLRELGKPLWRYIARRIWPERTRRRGFC